LRHQHLVAPQKGIVRRQVFGRSLGDALPLAGTERHAERPGYLLGYSRLHLEHVGEGGVERLLPGRGAGRDLHQLRAYLHPTPAARVAVPPYCAGEQVAHAQLAADLGQGLGRAAVLIRAGAGDDLHPLESRQLAAHRVGHAVGEVLVGRGAKVVERQDGDAARVRRVGDGLVP
jgi:hypothetical protein